MGTVNAVDDWFLMGTPWPFFAIWLAYISFVLKWGPSYMSTRPAFKLKNTLVLYNLLQVGLSCYIFYIILRGIYVYLLAKISELLDTVFFVLRKKMNQVSFLHVYHHSLMAIATWSALKYNPTDILVFLGTLNSFVHVIMYSYYGLSAYPSMAKYLWWKKYITSFQLIQFGLITLHALASSFISKCQTSYVLLFTIFFNLGLMIYLFRDFYLKSYSTNTTDVNNNKKTVLDDMIVPSILNEAYKYENLKCMG